MSCAICHQRKAKRHCPGVHGEICTLCCGTERENTVDCPLDCSYLREAHEYEFQRASSQPLAEMPHAQYELDDGFLRYHEPLIADLAARMLQVSYEQPGVLDGDLLAAADSLVRTLETLSSGLQYETLPDTPVPLAIYRGLQERIAEIRGQKDAPVIKDQDLLKCLVFLARLGRARGNGRPKAKGFLDFLRKQFPEISAQKTPGGLIISA